jgi:hypothetical protein
VFAAAGCCVSSIHAQEPVRLAERFDPADATHVEVKVTLTGRLAVPDDKGKPQVVPVAGASTLGYDERPLAADRAGTQKVLRLYQGVKFDRTVDGRAEYADLRPAVRRVVVQRSPEGRKAPFSPDGPLTAGELEVVRHDLFAPALVPGLLPDRLVRPGDRWPATRAAIADLTDFDPVEGGELLVTFAAVVSPDGRPLAKLSVAGTVTGRSDDGPARQTFDGVAYFDLRASRLTYLNLAGTQQLVTDGQVTGEVRGTLVVTRGPAARPLDVGGPVKETAATEENTQLVFDDPGLGVRFLYPRRWKVGPPKGRQLTLDEPAGGGLLITLEPAGKVPTADAFRRETLDFLRQQKWPAGEVGPTRKVGSVERFGLDAEANGQKVRLEYGVLNTPAGGATVMARLPWADREVRVREVERVLGSLVVGRVSGGR